jgi:hypothetical protein
MNVQHDADFSIRGSAASGTLEGAVSKPALATRNVHDNFECEMQANDYNTINDHNNKEAAKDEGSNLWNFPSLVTAAALAGTSRLNWLLVVERTVIYENEDI